MADSRTLILEERQEYEATVDLPGKEAIRDGNYKLNVQLLLLPYCQKEWPMLEVRTRKII